MEGAKTMVTWEADGIIHTIDTETKSDKARRLINQLSDLLECRDRCSFACVFEIEDCEDCPLNHFESRVLEAIGSEG